MTLTIMNAKLEADHPQSERVFIYSNKQSIYLKDIGTVPPLLNQVINCYSHQMNIGIYRIAGLFRGGKVSQFSWIYFKPRNFIRE